MKLPVFSLNTHNSSGLLGCTTVCEHIFLHLKHFIVVSLQSITFSLLLKMTPAIGMRGDPTPSLSQTREVHPPD